MRPLNSMVLIRGLVRACVSFVDVSASPLNLDCSLQPCFVYSQAPDFLCFVSRFLPSRSQFSDDVFLC